MKEKEIFLVLFRQHGETWASLAPDLEKAEEKLENWRVAAERTYPNYDWSKSGIIFQGKVVKRGSQVPSRSQNTP